MHFFRDVIVRGNISKLAFQITAFFVFITFTSIGNELKISQKTLTSVNSLFIIQVEESNSNFTIKNRSAWRQEGY